MHSPIELPQHGDEIRVLVEPGGCLDVRGTADSKALRRQLAAALGVSTMLEGRLVVVTDWLPGLDWRLQVSQQFADRLPGFTVDAIWQAIEPHLARWLEQPADAEVFVLSPEWGECALVPSAYRWKSEPVVFTLRCRWSQSLERRVS